MPKTGTRTYSRYTRQAVRLLGLQLHTRRLERGMTAAIVGVPLFDPDPGVLGQRGGRHAAL